MRRLLLLTLTTATAMLLSGCPPTFYCSVTNHTSQPVNVAFEYPDSPDLSHPHFDLASNGTRRAAIAPHAVVVGRDLSGRVIGELDLYNLIGNVSGNSRYYDYRLRQVAVSIRPKGIFVEEVKTP